ncbi:MAG: hypothetical protein NT061_06785 [Spirochaetes bacterium]|nr:hypothetical protein [Spirochaetota bacterium]
MGLMEEQGDRHADEADDARKELHEALREHRVDVIHIVGKAAFKIARGMHVEIRKRQLLPVGGQVTANVSRCLLRPGAYSREFVIGLSETLGLPMKPMRAIPISLILGP